MIQVQRASENHPEIPSLLLEGLADERLELGVQVDGLEVDAVAVQPQARAGPRLVQQLQALV